MVLAVFIGCRELDLYPSIYFLIPGGVITIVGLVLLISFMKKYPKDSGEASHAG
jgi:hypothetical protein